MTETGLITNHYALVVEDLGATVAHMSDHFDLEFNPPARIPFEVAGEGDSYIQVVPACYDTKGVIEIVEAQDRGPFAVEKGLGMHHFGGLVSDLDNAVTAQRETGNEVNWELSFDGQLIAVFFSGCAALPGQLELVTAQAPPLLEMFADKDRSGGGQ